MGYLQNKSVYLSGSMYGAKDDGVEWRNNITPKLEEYGLNVLDPCKKFLNCEIGKDKELFKQLIMEERFLELKERFFPILKLDLRCVDLAHFIILMYRPTLKTIGTIHEIVMANIEKKPILMYYPKEELHEFNPWMACLIKPNHFFSSWETMFAYLKQVDDGVFDTSLWY